MLTLTLPGLEQDRLVERTPYATIPPRVDYEMTELGESLIEPLATLASWAQVNRAKIELDEIAPESSSESELSHLLDGWSFIANALFLTSLFGAVSWPRRWAVVAAVFQPLRRTLHGAIRTENAAISWLGPQQCVAVGALMEE